MVAAPHVLVSTVVILQQSSSHGVKLLSFISILSLLLPHADATTTTALAAGN